MRAAIPRHPHTSSWRGTKLSTGTLWPLFEADSSDPFHSVAKLQDLTLLLVIRASKKSFPCV